MFAYYDAECNIQDGHSNTTTTWKDLSGNNHDATLNNFDFNDTNGWGKDSIICSKINNQIRMPVSIAKQESMTIQLLVTLKDLSDTELFSGNLGWANFYAETKDNGNIWIGANDLEENQNRFIPSDINDKITENELELITYTYDAQIKEAKIYRKDKLLASKTYITPQEAIEYFMIGKQQAVNKNYTRISLYNKVLSQEEVKQNYQIDKQRFENLK